MQHKQHFSTALEMSGQGLHIWAPRMGKLENVVSVLIKSFLFLQALTAEIVKTIRDIIALNPLYRSVFPMCALGMEYPKISVPLGLLL